MTCGTLLHVQQPRRRGPAPPGTGQQGPAAPAKRPVTLIVDNDWTGGDRYKVVKAWLERANKVHPHIKTELRDNAGLAGQDHRPVRHRRPGRPVPARPARGAGVRPQGRAAGHRVHAGVAQVRPEQRLRRPEHHPLERQAPRDDDPAPDVHDHLQRGRLPEGRDQGADGHWTWDDWLDIARKLNRPLDATPQWGTDLLRRAVPHVLVGQRPYLDAKGTTALWDTPACAGRGAVDGRPGAAPPRDADTGGKDATRS